MWYFLILSLAASSYVYSSSIDSGDSSAVQTSRHKRDDDSEPWKNPNLTTTIEPIVYHLTIRPDFSSTESLFSGVVSIRLSVLNSTNTFIVHAKQLNITKTRIFDRNETRMAIASQYPYEKNDYWVVKTVEPLDGKVTLLFYFTGYISNVNGSSYTPSGLFKIPYFNSVIGEQSWLWVTNFRPSSARFVFPCFDEPRFKARFRITIRHWRHFTPLSNMPVKSRKMSGDLQDTTFKLSPRMSSYLVAFAITDFGFKNKTVDGKQYRVWAQPDRLEGVDYALNVTPAIQSYLQKELNVSYPLEKLDQLAVPGDLLTDATENWGLVTYKESKLLVDMTQGDDADKYQALKLIANAMAHNYFGNLLTCRSWDQLWLNEGMSKFYEIRAVTAVDPTFGYNEYFYGIKVEPLMDADAANKGDTLLSFSNSTRAPIPLFDNIRREKGAAILRMVENMVEPPKFKKGITKYLQRHAYSTVVTSHLWDELQLVQFEQSINFTNLMSPWLKKVGIPLIEIEKVEEGNDIGIRGKQKLFLSDPLAVTNDSIADTNDSLAETDNRVIWGIYLDCITKGGTYDQIWMIKNRFSVQFINHLRTMDDWIVFNIDRTGYYRVNYEAFYWNRIIMQLNENHTVFNQLKRSQLLGDANAFVKAEQLGYDAYLNLTRYASKEKDLTPWLHMYSGFQEIMRIYNTTLLRSFQNYIFNLTTDLMDKLQVKDEGTYIEKQLRPSIMSLSCFAGHQGCIENTTRAFRAWIQNDTRNAVPKNLQRQVYCIGVAYSVDETDWNTTFERYRQETSLDERADLLLSLCLTRNTNLLERLLDFAIDRAIAGDVIWFRIMSDIAANPYSDHFAWMWFKRKYTEIERVLGSPFVGFFLLLSVRELNTRTQYQEVLDFYTVYPNVAVKMKEHIKDSFDSNIRWMVRNFDVITTWLETNVQN